MKSQREKSKKNIRFRRTSESIFKVEGFENEL